MSIRTIVNDIQRHAADFLAASRLRPVVHLAGPDARNDIVMFQTRGGRESVVAICVPRGAEYDGWERSAITPFSVRERPLGATGWILREATGVAPDDIVMLNDFSTDEERVAAIVSHLSARMGATMPADDLHACVCTDARMAEIVDRLARIHTMAGQPGLVEISGSDGAFHEECANVATLRLEDGRSIEVSLEATGIVLSVSTQHDTREFRLSGTHLLDEAMSPIEQSFSGRDRSADLGY